MLLRCLKAEVRKCRRSPVWLAFLLLPVFPAVLGTGNYLANQEVLENGWYSLWSQHTLFSSTFFLPALLGVFCAWQWRLEHTDHNWNSFLTAPVPVRDLYLAKLLLSAGVAVLAPGSLFWRRDVLACCFLLVVRLQAFRGPSRRNFAAGCCLALWAAFPYARCSFFQHGTPRLRAAGCLWPCRRHLGTDAHRPGAGLRLSLFAALPGDAGQQSPDGTGAAGVPLLGTGLYHYLHAAQPVVSWSSGRCGGMSSR